MVKLILKMTRGLIMLEEINLIDLKKLNYEQLDSLAKEIREEIITVVSEKWRSFSIKSWNC